MWKKIISSILLFYCFIIMIGCSNKNSEIALLSLQEVRDESKKTMEEVRKNEYKNLIFEDFTPKITNADEIYKICIGKKVFYYDNIENYLNKAPKILESMLEKDNLSEEFMLDPSYNIKYSKMLEQVKQGTYINDNPIIQYDDGKMFAFTMPSLDYMWVDKGTTKELFGKNIEDFSPLVPSNFDVVKEYCLQMNNNSLNDEYKLMDEKVSVSDAIKYCSDYFNNNLKYETNKNIKLDFYEADVLKLDDNTFGYHIIWRRMYNEIPFDSIKSAASGSFPKNKMFDIGRCLMIGKENIDFYNGVIPNVEIENVGKAIKEIIPLKIVFKNVSEKMSSATDFIATNIELIYYETSNNNETETASIKNMKVYSEAYPTWKVTLKNPNDDSIINCYVDILTGEVSTIGLQY